MECKPKYMYDDPMFMITVHTVLIEDNGVLMVRKNVGTHIDNIDNIDNKYGFAGGMVKAGTESILFAALRHVKEQTGILLRKDDIIPVDFRSEPERSDCGNIVDLGFIAILDKPVKYNATRFLVDFENKDIVLGECDSVVSDEDKILFERSLDIILMMKE